MPDVWTTNPPKLRNTMVEAGAVCGKESRVLKPRDPYWTCQVDSKGWLRDVYIHDIDVFAGLLWGKRFWRSKSEGLNRPS